ncbi:unnamed protein product, partial [Discosporangium mesarthrocarpum]
MAAASKEEGQEIQQHCGEGKGGPQEPAPVGEVVSGAGQRNVSQVNPNTAEFAGNVEDMSTRVGSPRGQGERGAIQGDMGSAVVRMKGTGRGAALLPVEAVLVAKAEPLESTATLAEAEQARASRAEVESHSVGLAAGAGDPSAKVKGATHQAEALIQAAWEASEVAEEASAGLAEAATAPTLKQHDQAATTKGALALLEKPTRAVEDSYVAIPLQTDLGAKGGDDGGKGGLRGEEGNGQVAQMWAGAVPEAQVMERVEEGVESIESDREALAAESPGLDVGGIEPSSLFHHSGQEHSQRWKPPMDKLFAYGILGPATGSEMDQSMDKDDEPMGTGSGFSRAMGSDGGIEGGGSSSSLVLQLTTEQKITQDLGNIAEAAAGADSSSVGAARESANSDKEAEAEGEGGGARTSDERRPPDPPFERELNAPANQKGAGHNTPNDKARSEAQAGETAGAPPGLQEETSEGGAKVGGYMEEQGSSLADTGPLPSSGPPHPPSSGPPVVINTDVGARTISRDRSSSPASPPMVFERLLPRGAAATQVSSNSNTTPKSSHLVQASPGRGKVWAVGGARAGLSKDGSEGNNTHRGTPGKTRGVSTAFGDCVATEGGQFQRGEPEGPSSSSDDLQRWRLGSTSVRPAPELSGVKEAGADGGGEGQGQGQGQEQGQGHSHDSKGRRSNSSSPKPRPPMLQDRSKSFFDRLEESVTELFFESPKSPPRTHSPRPGSVGPAGKDESMGRDRGRAKATEGSLSSTCSPGALLDSTPSSTPGHAHGRRTPRGAKNSFLPHPSALTSSGCPSPGTEAVAGMDRAQPSPLGEGNSRRAPWESPRARGGDAGSRGTPQLSPPSASPSPSRLRAPALHARTGSPHASPGTINQPPSPAGRAAQQAGQAAVMMGGGQEGRGGRLGVLPSSMLSPRQGRDRGMKERGPQVVPNNPQSPARVLSSAVHIKSKIPLQEPLSADPSSQSISDGTDVSATQAGKPTADTTTTDTAPVPTLTSTATSTTSSSCGTAPLSSPVNTTAATRLTVGAHQSLATVVEFAGGLGCLATCRRVSRAWAAALAPPVAPGLFKSLMRSEGVPAHLRPFVWQMLVIEGG